MHLYNTPSTPLSRPKPQRRLPPLRIQHPDNLHIRVLLHAVHSLRCDEDELPSNRPPRRCNNHLHAAVSVDAVHENITVPIRQSLLSSPTSNNSQFVQAPDRRPHGVPQRQQQTHGRKRLLSTRQRLGLPSLSCPLHAVRLHLPVSVPLRPLQHCLCLRGYQALLSYGQC
jgi:hypothetical protein